MSECEICHKDFKRLDAHKRFAHGKHPRWSSKTQAISPDFKQALSTEVNAPVVTRKLKVKPKSFVEPLHISEIWENVGNNTPLTFKAMVDDDSYQRSLRSIPYGVKGRLAANWTIFLIMGVVAVFLVAYFSGVIPGLSP
jgi:hypothetical protein